MKNPPAFQWYPADYLADMNVRLLSWASKGLYIDLLCYCWREGYIPADSSAIAMLCGCHDLAIVEPCLKLFATHPDDPSKLVHLRLIAERKKQIDNAERKSTGGKKGAETRWNKEKPISKQAPKEPDGIAIANPLGMPMAKNSSSSSTSSSSSKNKQPSFDEVLFFCQSIGLNRIDAEYMDDSWKMSGFTNNKKPVKDWQAQIRNWKRMQYLPSTKGMAQINKPTQPRPLNS